MTTSARAVTANPPTGSGAGAAGAAGFIRAEWPVARAVHVMTTTRHAQGASRSPFDDFNLGSRCGDEAAAVARNRAALVERFGVPQPPRWLHQVHGVGVSVEPDFGEPQADAALTRNTGRVLAVLTADCLPVAFAARDGAEVALAHAGWRGLAAGVLEATLAAMRAPATDVLAWLGPAAGPEAYEVGEDVRTAFVDRDAEAESAFAATRPGHWRVDLYALARRRLMQAGVPSASIYGGGFCTISDARRFYSHRRDGRSGRMTTLAWIAS